MKQHRCIQVEQIEVKISKLIKYIIKKSINILIIAIIFACLFPVTKYYLESRSGTNVNENDDENKYELMKLDVYQEQLEEYYKEYQSMLNYMETSIVMQLDYDNVYMLTMQFVVNASDEEIMDITTAYYNYYQNGDLAYDISVLDGMIDQKNISELIKVDCSSYANYETSSIINVKLYATNEEVCKKYVEIIKEAMQKFSKKLDENGKENEISVLSEAIDKRKATEVKTIQDSKNSYITNLDTNITNLKMKIEQCAVATSSASQEVGIETKFIVLGFIVGAFFAIIILSVIYIFSNKVKYAEEVAEYSDLTYLGSYRASKKTIIEKIFRSNCSNVLQKEIINNKIKMLYEIENEDIGAISVCRDKNAGYVEEMFAFDKQNAVRVRVIGDVIKDVEAMKLFSGSFKRVVVVISGEYAKYGQINDIIEICNIKNTDIIGYIYVE